MVPALWPGDLVTVKRCNPSDLGPESIVVFRQNDRLVTHRLVRHEGDCIVTRGDARPRLDAPVAHAEIVGCVESVTRNGHAVNPKFSLGRRAMAIVLRRSEWCTRFYLRVSSRIRRSAVLAAL